MKGVTVGYPLGIKVKYLHNIVSSSLISFLITLQAIEVEVLEVDFNPDFINRIIPKLDYPVLHNAATALGKVEDLPKELIADYENNVDFLKKIHHVLLEIDVVNGELICPETGRKFPINNGIPNMLLNEDEV